MDNAATRRGIWPVAFALVGLNALAYHNSFDVPFVFDDPLAITENPTIRKLWPLTDVLLPPRGEGLSVEGRPVLNLTLALNHAFGGTAVRGYHVVNFLIHACATLTLFGLVRRTLLLPRVRESFGGEARSALALAGIIAALWSLHPLQTESVTYVIQRAESLVGLFYLLTFYCFVRAVAWERRRPRRPEPKHEPTWTSALPWVTLAVTACTLGMATKEVMVSAPLMILLFDRAFVAGTWREALRARGRVHAALFATWILLAVLVVRAGTRGGTAGFGINVTPWQYALTQFEAVSRYVWLSFWPHPLIFDYGVDWVESTMEVLPYALFVGALLAGTIIAWRRAPKVAVLALIFFAVLSPTSSFVPGNRQTLAEHRMYLPLAVVITLTVCGVRTVTRGRVSGRGLIAWGAAAAVALGALTTRRNFDYRSELALYRDTAMKRPGNGFARYNFAKALAESGRHAEALAEYDAALRLMPNAAGFHYNLANSLAALGRVDDAIARFEAALRLEPNYANAHFNLGNLLLQSGERARAAEHFRAAVMAEPTHLAARTNLAGVVLELGRTEEAATEFQRVLRDAPGSVEAHFGLGNAFLLQERWSEAARKFETVLRLRPELAIARERLELARDKIR